VIDTSLMKRQCVIIHTVRQSEGVHYTRHLGSNTLSVKTLYPQNIPFRTNITGLSVCLLRIGQLFTEFCQIVYHWVTTNRIVMNDVIFRIYEVVYIMHFTGQGWT